MFVLRNCKAKLKYGNLSKLAYPQTDVFLKEPASNLRKLCDTKKLYILTCVVYSRSSQSIKIGSNQVIFID